MIELKQLLDENKNKLSDILRECQSGSPEQALLEAKMGPLLDDFAAIEEQLFSRTLEQKDQPPTQDDD